MRKATGAALVALLIGASLVGCSADDGDTDRNTVTVEDAEGADEWAEVEVNPQEKSDSLLAVNAEFRTLWPDLYGEGNWGYGLMSEERATELLPHGLVMGPDKVAYLAFTFRADEVERTISKSYVTDSEKSSKERADLECDPLSHMRTFVCYAHFAHAGGTFYGVIETEPAYPEDATYGSKRASGSITVQEYGGESDACGKLGFGDDDAQRCLSLPKE